MPTQANRGTGLDGVKAALVRAIRCPPVPTPSPFPASFQEEIRTLGVAWGAEHRDGREPRPRFLLERLLLDVDGSLQRLLAIEPQGDLARGLESARSRLARAGCRLPGVETQARYDWARRMLEGVVALSDGSPRETGSDRLDRILTHRVGGLVIFALVMLVIFQSVFVWAEPLMNRIDGGVESLGGWIEASMDEGALRSLLVQGVIHGAGGVLTFLPQIMILFAFIGILEDCGYMARAAYLMDRWMVRVGLSGKSFVPMLSSFACAVPGIMAARVIENERDRLATILAAPLMTCSARLPVYALLIAAFIPKETYLGGLLNLQGLTLAALYLLGILAAIGVVLVLKRTLLRGQSPPFLMELPSYKWPSLRTIAFRVFERAWLFVRCAGTLILAVSVIIWAALYYPHHPQSVTQHLQHRLAEAQARLDQATADSPAHTAATNELEAAQRAINGEYQRQSYLGRLGRWIEPVFRPLGWDWRIGSAVIASFPARETVVATLGVIYDLGTDVEEGEEATQLQAQLARATWDGTDRPVFNVPVALSIMVFFALCAQCAATLAVIRRETNSWRWPAFTFAYMTTLAYLGALVTYQAGTWLSG